ncbi:MAG TPA: DUF742 domain-containing protein [Pseudonocardiaceae bacterium]|nr:DUF742 domain-containing protein [Pseudonocardiaceae bacterium]
MNGSSGSSRYDGGEQSFAEVVNNLSGGPRRARRHRRQAPPPAAAGPAPATPAGAPERASRERDEWSEPASGASVARPYAWTRGRTSPVFDLGVETLVSTAEHGYDMAVLACPEHWAVAELCGDPRSVAEVAALLSLPLGVARVLLADMAGIGLVVVHRNPPGEEGSYAGRPDMVLMERVLSGLRRL